MNPPLKIAAIALALVAALHPFDVIAQAPAPVSISDDGATFTLANGLVTARIAKRNGDLVSLEYQGVETIGAASRGSGYWSHRPAGAQLTARITIDPKANGGARGEISIKGISGGQKMGNGPGGSTVADIEVRYAIERGMSGVYTYSIFDHPAGYPATSVGEARFCAKLNDNVFDWMTVDANRNLKMITTSDWNHGTPMNMKEARRMNTGIYKGQVEHKYDYSANQFETLAWGWSSTTRHVGIWFVNPTIEYLSGGPTKFELSAHRDATFGTDLNAPAPPCLLNYWRGSHYGGSRCEIAAGEAWTKVIGPFLIYCNSGPTPGAMWRDALVQSKMQSAAWPYGWVTGLDYPHKEQRATVSGRLVLNDPLVPKPMAAFGKLLVGLAAPAADGVTWANDAKHYQFWVRGAADGRFAIPNVRPGTYTLSAIADGVLGEFAKTDVVVAAGKPLDLGPLEWRPVRHGRQLWDIGIASRDGAEFFKGNDYFHWGWYLEYPKLFPRDVSFTVGKSDFRKDWFFEQVPHAEKDDPTGKSPGRSTTWTITFDLPKSPRGTATLRLAIAGVGAKNIDISLNGKSLGAITALAYNGTINRDGIGGSWIEKDLPFDATALKAGPNVLTLTIPAGGLASGILYDYLRLELDESAGAGAANAG